MGGILGYIVGAVLIVIGIFKEQPSLVIMGATMFASSVIS